MAPDPKLPRPRWRHDPPPAADPRPAGADPRPARPRTDHDGRRRGRRRRRRTRARAGRPDLGAPRVSLYRAASTRRCSCACAATATSCSTARSATRAATARATTPMSRRCSRRTDTPFCVYSTSKGITAFVVHMLADRGALDIDDRVTDYIPEYGAHGKGETTIAHVLAHRAGVAEPPAGAARPRPARRPRARSSRSSPTRSRSQHPGHAARLPRGDRRLHPRRDRPARHRAKTIRDVLATEILEPLGFRWGNYGVAPEDVDAVGLSYVTGAPAAAAAVDARRPRARAGRWRRRSSCRTTRAS